MKAAKGAEESLKSIGVKYEYKNDKQTYSQMSKVQPRLPAIKIRDRLQVGDGTSGYNERNGKGDKT